MSKEVKGTLYGVGVGPGDPELLTLKAYRVIRDTDYIAVPGKVKEDTYAWQIAAAVVPDIDKKVCLDCHVEMTKDRAILDHNYDLAAQKIEKVLESGKDVAFLTIGDPTIYATYMYVHQRVERDGFRAELISGIPSFCAVAARLDISLSERSDQLHIIPSSYQIADALELPGNKILMKAASKMGEVKKQLLDRDADVYMIENCGMENERIYRSAEEIPEDAGYLSVVIVKDR